MDPYQQGKGNPQDPTGTPPTDPGQGGGQAWDQPAAPVSDAPATDVPVEQPASEPTPAPEEGVGGGDNTGGAPVGGV